MRMLHCGKRILVITVLCLGCLQFFHMFATNCPQWFCDAPDGNANSLFSENYVAVNGRRREKGFDRSVLRSKVSQNVFGRYRNSGVTVWEGGQNPRKRNVRFAINGSDVLVFLHVQKTGGTAFGKNMVKNLVDPISGNNTCECKGGFKRCQCYRPGGKSKEWLFSRFSTGWRCGLHADWTELTNCVDQVLDQSEGAPETRRYFYMTLLRDPFRRYLSEFLHVQRGATWRHSRHWCGGRFALAEEINSCFKDDTWEGVTLEEFLNCPDNLAANRQTRMLADLEIVGCYDKKIMSALDRDALMLASAKENLEKMAFFGIAEEMDASQFLFEETFGLHFTEKLNSSYEPRGENYQMSAEDRKTLLDRVALDMKLYEFAKDLFRRRLESVKTKV